MKAKDKQHFIKSWGEQISDFNWLMQSAETIETMNELREVQEKMRQVVQKVADECYGDG